MGTGRRLFMDTFAIYYSKEDRYWVAHSLRTDQFGTGDCVVNALVDGLKAVDQVIELAKRKPDTQVFRSAPADVWEIARTAKRLPDELYQIAHKRLYGKWESSLNVTVDAGTTPESFTRKVREEVFVHAS